VDWPQSLYDARVPRSSSPLALYAGSFDPPTIGHLWMIEQGAALFPRLVVAVGRNPAKRCAFTVEERMEMLRRSTRAPGRLEVTSFGDEFLIRFAKTIGATHILRGIRSASDYEYERAMRNINGDLGPGITTVFLMPPRDIAEVSSSMVKGLIGPTGWKRVVRKYVPPPVLARLIEKFHDRPGPGQ
jgi:pantetheine-phosphate adenylyltransferase